MPDRILIVDDEVEIGSILAQRLTRDGFSCVTACTGKEALTHFYTDDFSLVISDLRMPEMNGLDLIKKIKETNPNIIVIVITAFPEMDTALKALRMGAYDFIVKPFDLDLVASGVKKRLEKKIIEENIEAYNQNVEKLVKERTNKLQQALCSLKEAHLSLVRALTGAIDAKDPFTRGHSERVRRMSLEMGLEMGFNEEMLEGLVFGALLHDIGMIGIRDEVLQKQSPLTTEEYEHIKEHPLIGSKILEGIEFFRNKIPMIRNHHERFDGSGYPDGLSGEAIPAAVRIIAITDAFDAMTSIRPYREAITLQDALKELERCKGKQFDPQVLDIFFHKSIYETLRAN